MLVFQTAVADGALTEGKIASDSGHQFGSGKALFFDPEKQVLAVASRLKPEHLLDFEIGRALFDDRVDRGSTVGIWQICRHQARAFSATRLRR